MIVRSIGRCVLISLCSVSLELFLIYSSGGQEFASIFCATIQHPEGENNFKSPFGLAFGSGMPPAVAKNLQERSAACALLIEGSTGCTAEAGPSKCRQLLWDYCYSTRTASTMNKLRMDEFRDIIRGYHLRRCGAVLSCGVKVFPGTSCTNLVHRYSRA